MRHFANTECNVNVMFYVLRKVFYVFLLRNLFFNKNT